MTNHFELFKNELPTITTISSSGGANGLFGQESLRFYSMAGTILANFKTGKSASVDERYITHVLARSLIENYFWLLYIFDNPAKKLNRYEELVNSFKRDYGKLLNEQLLPNKNQLEAVDPAWSSLSRALDVNSMLAQITNDYGDRLSYLYFIYRITSFDTHGKNLENIFQTTFGKKVNFPVLDIGYAFDLIANQYLVILKALRDAGESNQLVIQLEPH